MRRLKIRFVGKRGGGGRATGFAFSPCRDIDFLTGSKSENERANDANARPLARVEYRCSEHVRPPHLHSTVLAAFNCTDRGRPIDDAARRSRHLAILVTVKSNWIIDHRCVSTRS